MRVERRGGPPDLQAAFKKLVLENLLGRALDDNQRAEAAEGMFPDFACFRDLLLIEMKHLETDQGDRVNQVFEKLIDPAEQPLFFGQREGHFITDAVSNGDAINEEIDSKLSRTIEKILSKANRQFASYRTRHPRKNSVNLCVILNSKLQEYTPNLVIGAIHSKMKTKPDAKPRFFETDAVLYISEKHFLTLADGRIAQPVASYIAIGAEHNYWKMQLINRVMDSWSHMRRGGPSVQSDDLDNFETIQDIPSSMSRSEFWILEYQRNPYLKNLSLYELKMFFHRTMAVNYVSFLKGNWPKPPREKAAEGMRRFQHVIEETNRRGLDMRQFDLRQLSLEEKAHIYEGLPAELINMLNRNPTTPDSPHTVD